MLKKRKAQGLSLNTIVVAAIVLTVLVVLIMVFTGRMTWFNRGYTSESGKSCSDYGGATWEAECPIEQRAVGIIDPNVDPGVAGKPYCCLPATD